MRHNSVFSNHLKACALIRREKFEMNRCLRVQVRG